MEGNPDTSLLWDDCLQMSTEMRAREHSRSKPQASWRPWPLRTLYMLIFCIVCVTTVILLQFIIRACHATGCPLVPDGSFSIRRVSTSAEFLYNFLPALLGLCFGLLWMVPHHDIMRLEPYFQMSVEGGQRAHDTLLLDYSLMFPMKVPITAFKRRYVYSGL